MPVERRLLLDDALLTSLLDYANRAPSLLLRTLLAGLIRPLRARTLIASNALCRSLDIMTLCALESPKHRPLRLSTPRKGSCYSPQPHAQLQLSPPHPTVVRPLSLEPHLRQGQELEIHLRCRRTAGERRSINLIRSTPRRTARER
ncbi:hypothetical protein CPLU01_12183 [Colletotrichum plurivorum]|uniref:Uncharacterized protein n=1 Tax=Colletotrichum plurivorum TaxID=2175906 RepID=A0A8H6JZY6_9PEZI|nr:hypothetical protein CPLU01_12183 [Colletotrichum plurivorum]